MWYIEEEDDFYYLVMSISQEQFENEIQYPLESTEQEMEFQMRIAARDGDWNIIEHLTQEWTQTVIGNDEESPCLDSYVTYVSQTPDLTIAFESASTDEEDRWASF